MNFKKIAAAAILSGSLILASAASAAANSYEGNKNCADLAPDGVTWEEFKIDAVPKDGDHEDPNSDLVITISNASSQTFDWASDDLDMAAVLVKGSNAGLQYLYPGDSDFADTGLHAPIRDETKENPYFDISHVSFCFEVGAATQPTVTEPPATQPPAEVEALTAEPPATQPPAEVEALTAEPSTEVLGKTLARADTLARTGAATPALAIVGGLILALGLAMLASRRIAFQTS